MRPALQKVNWGLLLLCVALTLAARAQDDQPSQAAGAGMDRYRILWERNIFDPNRVPPKPENAEEAAPPAPEATRDRLVLTGVLLVSNAHTAFFEGTSPAFNTHGVEGDAVGPFTLESVGMDGVVLTRDGARFSLAPGAALTGLNDAGWTVEEGAAAPRDMPATGSGTAAAPGSGAPPSGSTPAGDTDILEKLKARRQQELEQ